jgi:nicotinate-nucleotide adenylyltransferase
MTNIVQGLAILGGTFDPIHCGHIASAKAVRKSLGVPRLKLVPSFIPPHRAVPGSTAEQRLAMLKMAIEDDDGLEVDDRELARQGISYTVDTLDSFRSELGQTVPLYFVLGFDSYCTLPEWMRWQEITRKCHLVVLARPGYEDEIPAQIVRWSKDKIVEEPKHLRNRACGGILAVNLVQVDVSATVLRKNFREGLRPTGKMPEKVIDYAIENDLYCSSAAP